MSDALVKKRDLQNLSTSLTPEITSWLKQCPNPEQFMHLIQTHQWLNTKVSCDECGEKRLRKDLRYNEANPCGDLSELICNVCWYFFDEGTVYDPDYRAPPWPEKLDLESVFQP